MERKAERMKMKWIMRKESLKEVEEEKYQVKGVWDFKKKPEGSVDGQEEDNEELAVNQEDKVDAIAVNQEEE
eukprot:scaffold504826_cov24-Attheya_sp.AAC.1